VYVKGKEELSFFFKIIGPSWVSAFLLINFVLVNINLTFDSLGDLVYILFLSVCK
jgi:hypothetical protein